MRLVTQFRLAGRRRWLLGALVLLAGFAGCCALAGTWLSANSTRLPLLQRAAVPVYPGSTLLSDTTAGTLSTGSEWEIRIYQTSDRLEIVRAYLESQLGTAWAGDDPLLGRTYMFSWVEPGPLDFLRTWAPAAIPVQGITVVLYASAPMTQGTTIKVKSEITRP
jgi:hypothetical protein